MFNAIEHKIFWKNILWFLDVFIQQIGKTTGQFSLNVKGIYYYDHSGSVSTNPVRSVVPLGTICFSICIVLLPTTRMDDKARAGCVSE